ncbi:hypothetical protein [Robiginitomaculum antarcticum]|uniref:hypothetical protein n=1 Tax=Robiginitomaculum antarcticum TaxID=437507 RepID=UPI00035D5205|nr:hypothetical protein [Robiginitomaculum antarcticum]
MTNLYKNRKHALIITSAGLFTLLAGCASVATQSDTAATKSNMSMAAKTAMRADCQAMHDKMMSGKTMGDMPGHKMMTPEMMKKHQTCMELMPDMKAKMQEKCAAHKAGTMDHSMMGDGKMNHDMMDQHCAMMLSADGSDGS